MIFQKTINIPQNSDSLYLFKAGNTDTTFQHKSNHTQCKINNHTINTHAFSGSIIGTLIPMIIISKKQNKNLFKIAYEFKEMIFIGTGSILGGLIGGIIRDKNKKIRKKMKEANFQWITNLFFPTLFVDQLLKYADKKFPKKTKSINSKITKALAVIAGLSIGMKLGEFVTKNVNYCIDKNNKHKRSLNSKDILLHIDDIPIALTLSKIPYVDKLIPFCFIYSGYQSGK